MQLGCQGVLAWTALDQRIRSGRVLHCQTPLRGGWPAQCPLTDACGPAGPCTVQTPARDSCPAGLGSGWPGPAAAGCGAPGTPLSAQVAGPARRILGDPHEGTGSRPGAGRPGSWGADSLGCLPGTGSGAWPPALCLPMCTASPGHPEPRALSGASGARLAAAPAGPAQSLKQAPPSHCVRFRVNCAVRWAAHVKWRALALTTRQPQAAARKSTSVASPSPTGLTKICSARNVSERPGCAACVSGAAGWRTQPGPHVN